MSQLDQNPRRKPYASNTRAGIFAVALVASFGLSMLWGSTAFAWDFKTSTCIETKSESFSTRQPQAYIMLDRSGSMGTSTSVTTCQKCDYEYTQGSAVESGSTSWNSSGATKSVTFPSGSSPSKTKSYSGSGASVSFNFSNMTSGGATSIPVTIDLWGDYNASSEYAVVSADGNVIGSQCKSGCNQCPGSPDTKTFNVPANYVSDGKLTITVDNTSNVGDFCTTDQVGVSIPSKYFAPGSLSTSSCMGVEVGLYGDYGASTEYADISLDGQQVGRICDGANCSDCGGPFVDSFEPTSSMLSDGILTTTISNTSPVDTFCSQDKADVTLKDYTSGSTLTGSFDCPSCIDDTDCRDAVPAPGCAVSKASLSKYSCSTSASKWQVASRSLRSVVKDLTQPSPDTAEFGLGLFNTSGWNKVSPTEDAYSAIDSALKSESPGGGTDLRDAINKSRNVLSNSAGSGRIQASILVTDGKHNYDDTDVITAACAHQAQEGNLYVVGFASGTDPAFNDAVAAAGGTGVCCQSTTAANCTRSSNDYVDPCNLSESQLHGYSDGRALNCRGAHQANNGTALKSAITGIASNLSCMIDVSQFGSQKWKDSYYGCAPDYDCFKVKIPGVNKRIYHKNSNNSPNGWTWNDPTKQEAIVLDNYWCNKVKSLTDNTVTTTRACMCSKPKNGLCPISNPQTCDCEKGTWSCNQGSDQCNQYSHANCPPQYLHGVGTKCSVGLGVCKKTGATMCNPQFNLVCTAANFKPKKNASPEKCDGLDNDCDGKTDEGVTKSCDTGKPGRCGPGIKTCSNGSYSSCKPKKRAVPEVCNGLDDDCSGVVDDIKESWASQNWSVSINNKTHSERACGKKHQCVCDTGDADTTYRGSRNSGSGSLDDEFDEMVSSTQTDCYCSE